MNPTTAVSSTDIQYSCPTADNSSTTGCEDANLANDTTPALNAYNDFIVAGSNSLTVYLICQILAIVVLNGTIIVVIACDKRLHKPANAYILSNACNDFLIGIIPMTGIVQNSISAEWKLGDAFCYIVALFDAVCASVSLTHTFMLAYDRYLAITHPLEYSKPNRKTVIGIHIALTYTVPFAVWTPPLVLYSPKDAFCYILPPPRYEIVQYFILYYAYMSGVVYLYACCMRGLWSQYFKVRPQNGTGGGITSGQGKAGGDLKNATKSLKCCGESSITSICVTDENSSQITFVDVSMSIQPKDKLTPVEKSSRSNPSPNVLHSSKQSNKRRNDLVRSLRNAGIYAVAFVSLVFPYVNAIIICDIFDANRCESYMAFQVVSCVPYYYSIVHPILYIATQREFRASAKHLVLKSCRRLIG